VTVRSDSPLTLLQRQVLEAFFAHEQGFILIGGVALAGFHLGHRPTSDLDLFTHDDATFERGRFVVEKVTSQLGASLVVKQQAPGFLRVILQRPDDGVVIDLVIDRHRESTPIEQHGTMRIDTAFEILANKLTTLVGRQEARDLVDAYCLEKSGLRIEDALERAREKDGGCTAATLAWLLSSFPIPVDQQLPNGVVRSELVAWRDALIKRLQAVSLNDARTLQG